MSRIIVLQACRHGVGCSHLVANLAVILMQRGYRVGILDTDPRVGGIRTLMGLDETQERNLEAYWWLSPHPDSVKSLTSEFRRYGHTPTATESGIYLPPIGGKFTLDSPQFIALQKHYGEGRAPEILQALATDLRLDFLLIDNQPEMTDDNLMGLLIADITLLLLQLDSYDLQRTAVLLEVLRQLEVEKVWLVPSLVLPAIEAISVKRKLESTYHQPVAGILYLSEEMIRLASGGVFCLHHPTHELTRTMLAIADCLEQDAQALSSSASA